jgi:hypothetical protein
VEYDDLVVGGRLDVQLDAVGALVQGQAEGGQGVLGGVGGSAAVGDDEGQGAGSARMRDRTPGCSLDDGRRVTDVTGTGTSRAREELAAHGTRADRHQSVQLTGAVGSGGARPHPASGPQNGLMAISWSLHLQALTMHGIGRKELFIEY